MQLGENFDFCYRRSIAQLGCALLDKIASSTTKINFAHFVAQNTIASWSVLEHLNYLLKKLKKLKDPNVLFCPVMTVLSLPQTEY